MADRFLVTGAAGCLGAWTIDRLLRDGAEPVAFDLSNDRRRLALVAGARVADDVRWVTGDIRDFTAVTAVIDEHSITHVLHLAALQVPFCRADPVAGAQVNVTGTVNILEAARRSDGRVRGLVYASSVAVFGAADRYRGGIAHDDDALAPASLYGVYKQANESTARVYFDDWGLSSIGVRPSVIYGVGRDQGMTSSPTVAMLRAAAGESTHIGYAGSSTYHHADDVAAVLIACATAGLTGARVHNVGGTDATVEAIAAVIERYAPGTRVSYDGSPLALPAGIDGSPLEAILGPSVSFRGIEEGIAGTIDDFRRLLRDGLIQVATG
jgi:nucleoside-diphosphate-sugar epimerase